MSFTDENVDRLTSLPENILSKILSLMPTKFAVRTSILSKRWRYTWAFIHNLDFDDSLPIRGGVCLSNIVDRVLKRCLAKRLYTFRLKLSNDDIQGQSVSRLIRAAIRLDVCELDIDVKVLRLPLSISSCKTLTKFRLHLYHSYSAPCNLPCLKILDIVVHSDDSIRNAFEIIHGCPSLETLYLVLYGGSRIPNRVYGKDVKVYNIIIPSLKRLKIKFLQSHSVNKVVLNVSNLEYLYVGGDLCSYSVTGNLASQVEVKVSGEIRKIHLLGDFLEGISGVKSLYLSFKYQYWRDSPVFNLPKFPNLKCLKLNGDGGATWNFIHKVLENSRELEHLSIKKLDHCHWNEQKSVPTCMLMNLKTVEYDLIKAGKCNTDFLNFILLNSKVLKELTITCRAGKSLKGNERFCARLSELPRASKDCQLQFI